MAEPAKLLVKSNIRSKFRKRNLSKELFPWKASILCILMCDIWLVLMQQCMRSCYVKNIAGTFRPFRNVRKQPAGYMYVMLLEMSGLQVPLLLLDCLVYRDCAAPPRVWCTGYCAAPRRV